MPIRLMVALLAICTTAFTTNVYAAYGRTVGNFGVSAVGSAQYSIPIWAPPGPRGIQPQVSLSYDSDQWIGPMGIGWALGGLGQITRCNKTVAQDGASAAVGLSASDGYCFNGNRLRMVTGTYGAAGSTYQTEIADFSNITANGTAGNGPEYWSVRAKNGLTYYFGFVDANGNGANSAPVAQGTTTVLTWFLSKVIDRAGNNYVVNYTAQTGTAVPASILWTPTSYGASTYAYKMLFNYSGNNPATSSIQYVDGTLVSNTELLSSIEILAGGVVIKDYFLGYQLSPSTGRNEMISVLECADTGKANCLLPTSISYQGGSPGVSTTPNTAAPGGAQLTARYDLNGDGYPDLFYAVGSTMYVAFGSATGYQTPFNTGIPTTAVVGRLTGGIQDAVLANNGGTWYYYNWNGSSFTGTSTKISYDTSSAGYQLADINGDGLPDLIDLNYVYSSFTKKYTASIITILNTTAGGTFGLSETSNTAYSAVVVSAQLLPPDTQYGKLRRYDFNGDGLDDIVLKTITGTSSNYYINTEELISNGSGFTAQTISSALNGSYAPVFFTDWNDDRCTDFVSVNVLYIAGCNGTAAETYSLPGTLLLAFDWNADGRTDILVANGSTLGVYLAGGSGAPTLTSTTFPYNSSCLYVRLDVTGDGLDDLGCQTTSLTYFLHNGTSDLATAFSDGYGNSAQPNYIPISEGSYTNATDAIAGYQNYIGPLYVVNQVTYSDPSNQPSGSYQQTFTYAGAWMNLQGRGFSGFESIQAHDSRNSVWSTSSYNLGFPYTGMLTSSIASQNSNNTTPISTLANTLAVQTLIPTANNESYFPYVSKSTTESYEVGGTKNGQLITTSVTTYGAPSDNYGNFDTVSTVLMDNDSGSPYYNDTWTTTTVNTISADATTWCLSLPTETTVTNSSTAPNGGGITRTITYPAPDYTNCRETQTITAPGTAYQVTEVYGYDTTFGNLLTDAVTGYNAVTKVSMPTRTTTLTWNTTGQFPATVQNALGQTITLGFDPNSGMKTSQTDPNWTMSNPLKATWTPDPFFRVSSQTNLDGTSTTWAYNNCATAGCVNTNNRMTVTQTTVNVGGGTQRIANTYTDSLGRTLVTSKQMLNGAYDRNEVQYDNLGRVHLQGVPCTFVSCATYWTTNTYDIVNRITESQRPISATNSTLQSTIYGYAGRTATVKDPLGNTKTLISLVNGALARTTDAKGYSINFAYDAFGSRVATTDSASPANTLSTATYSYGLKAFKTASTDMDRGPRSYTVDPLGEVTAYTDAKGQSFSITYDSLSRKLVRTEPDLTTTWTWGNTASSYNIGKLAQVTAASSAGTWSDTYTYDSYTRYSSETISNPGDRTYEYVKTYSPTTGLPASLQYPVDISFVLTVEYTYAYGILQAVSTNSYGGTLTYWAANTTNPRGQVTQGTLGNGVVKTATYDAVTGWLSSVQAGPGGGSALQNNSFAYDEDGDLTQRQDNNQGLTEDYYYDTLNRLDHSTLNGALNLQMEYDTTGMGNIASRSDVAGGAAWTYDPVRKHAVTQAGSSAYTYAYDANGNASSRNGYPITWTSYNLPTGISTATESVVFAYDANRQRWQEIYTGGPNGTETTYRAGKLFEIDTYGGYAHYRHFVYAGNELVSIDDRTTVSTPQYYVLSDHQGSYLSLENSGNPGTNFVAESFTPFGNRRNGETWSGAPTTSDSDAINSVSRRGYTDESALGISMGLNHLNGRVEDAILGRFLSVDPHITDPTNAQNYNRYSYVNNNPTTFVDPSGFDCAYRNSDGTTTPVSCSSDQVDVPGQTIIENEDGTQEIQGTASRSTDQSSNGTSLGLSISSSGGFGGGGPGGGGGGGSGDGTNGTRQAQGHAYSTRNQICQRPLTAPEISDLISRFTVPNVYLQGQPLSAGIHMVAAWGIPGGFVTTTFSADGLTGFNQTTPFHIFTGTVVRSVDNTGTGADMVTYGYGGYPPGLPTSPNSSSLTTSSIDIGAILDQMNNVAGPMVFNAVDQQAARFAQNHYSGC